MIYLVIENKNGALAHIVKCDVVLTAQLFSDGWRMTRSESIQRFNAISDRRVVETTPVYLELN